MDWPTNVARAKNIAILLTHHTDSLPWEKYVKNYCKEIILLLK